MSAFANALRAFQADRLTRDQVVSEVYRSLAVDRVAPGQLRVELGEVHALRGLPSDLRAVILERLASWDQTVTTPSVHAKSPHPTANQPSTIIMGEQPSVAHSLDTGGKAMRASAVAVGAVLQGRFRLVNLIGQGGMSRVFKAIDLRRVEAGSSETDVAVKVLTVPFSDFFGSMAALQSEAHKLQRLTHPNIVRVMDCDRDGQTVFMTMELLSGQSVYVRLQRSEEVIPPAEVEHIVTSVAHALEFAHEHHIVHGDLKPGNIILTDAGDVKVIDFGMARFIAGTQANSADPPAAMTPRYASPQMLDGEAPAAVDDVYALACLTHEMLAGRHPFATQLADGARIDAQTRLERSPQINPRQFKAITHALAYERGNRTQSVRDFLAEFAAPATSEHNGRIAWAAAGMAVVVFAGIYWLRTHGASPAESAPAATVSASIPTSGNVIRDCPVCPLMAVLPAGQFAQGSASDDATAQPFERPQHQVTIAQPFAIGQNEVTVGEYRQFAGTAAAAPGGAVPIAGCNVYDGKWHRKEDADWKNPSYAVTAQDPVSCVSWNDATRYAKWLSATTGQRYRLASASEWEYAARAGSAAAHPWSAETEACSYANVADQSASARYPGWRAFACDDGFVDVAPVGSFKANAFGLNDMLGNVFEWVQDCWHDSYEGAPRDGAAWLESACKEHELRGGSWFTAPSFMRTAYRNRFDADYRSSSVGFRLVREVAR